MRGRSLVLCLGLAAGAGPARADVIHLDTTASQECVIIEITDAWVKFHTPMGRASLPRHKVIAVTRDTDEANRQLLKQWQAERAAKAARERARVRSAQVERLRREALGLVQYEGEWITPEERAGRVQAKREAKRAAAALDRTEAAAGHHFQYGIWFTPATYRAVRSEEEQLRSYQAELVALQKEIALLNDQIESARMLMLQDPDMDSMERRGERIAKLKSQLATATTEADQVRRKGDAVAERIETLVRRARERLERLLRERGESPQAVALLAGPS